MKSVLALLGTASLLGTITLGMAPAQAQRVVDVTPSVNNQSVANDALISGVFDTASGTVDVATVKIFVDGREVTSASAITRNFFSYRPTQPLRPGSHQVQVSYSNSQGQQRVASWMFTVTNPQPDLVINRVTHNATDAIAQDATLLTTIAGTPGVKAAVLLIENGDVVRRIPAAEVSPGVYVASYTLTPSHVNSETIAIGELQQGTQKIFAAATQPILVTAAAAVPDVTDVAVEPDAAAVPAMHPLQPEFTSHRNGQEISTRGFTLTGMTQPNARVQINVKNLTSVAGGFVSLGSNTLIDTTVTADPNGAFSVQVPAPLVVNSDTVYEIEALARKDGETSQTTRFTLEQR